VQNYQPASSSADDILHLKHDIECERKIANLLSHSALECCLSIKGLVCVGNLIIISWVFNFMYFDCTDFVEFILDEFLEI